MRLFNTPRAIARIHAQAMSRRIGTSVLVVCLALSPMGVGAIAAPWVVTSSLSMSGQTAACADCGTVESVTQVQHDTPNTGVGAALGAALGGLIASKIGGEDGKAIATILGLLGGVWAGNALEKQIKQAPTYQVVVRMENKTQRTFELKAAMPIGARVKVQGDTIVLDENAAETA
jgi:outer membrane lipoprotein SlyB